MPEEGSTNGLHDGERDIHTQYWMDRNDNEWTHRLPEDRFPRIFTVDGCLRVVDSPEQRRLLLCEPRMEPHRLGRYWGYLTRRKALSLAWVILKWLIKDTFRRRQKKNEN